ncbi:MAG: radical SAM protein [Candidatus Omnitrophota bacterium]
MKKLLLIHPATITETAGWGETKSWGMPPLGLAYVAASTPDNWEVKILDEYTDKIDFGVKADIVGITSYTVNAPRAYQIAGEFRKRGITTVMGGIHASMMPEEALKHTDAVVVGEAEFIWEKVISDFENKRLKRKYTAERMPLNDLPIPRRDLFSDKYVMDVIQTTRGCPFNCEFCSVTSFNGAEYRQRPVNEVLDELETIKKKVVYFVDDNILGFGKSAEQRSMDLFRGMLERKINKIWITQTSINIADNPEILKYAYKSGCRFVFIGIESIIQDTLEEMKKAINLKKGIENLSKAIRRIQNSGIGVIGAFIVGNDHDDITVFRKTLDFINRAQLDVFQLSYLTPFPGTKLYGRMEREGRIFYDNFPGDWERCDMDQVMIRPKKMTIDELIRGYDYIIRQKITTPKILLQFLRTLVNTRDVITAVLGYNFNRDFQKYVVPDDRFHGAGGGV